MRAASESFVEYLNSHKTPLFPEPVYIEGVKDGTTVEVALQWNDGFTESVFCFANNIHTPEGGTHLEGFKQRADPRDQRLRPQGAGCSRPPTRTSPATTCARVWRRSSSVKLVEPQFEGQTKAKLGNSEVRAHGGQPWWPTSWSSFLEENPHDRPKRVMDKCLSAARAREAARKARDLTRRKTALEIGGAARQAGRLLRARSRQVRDLPRRGRFRRRHRQEGPRPPLPGDPAPARQDIERRKGARGPGAGQRRRSRR